MTSFHNPYNFVPALPRGTSGELGDREPVGHHAYLCNYWSGSISIKLKTKTPLLISDTLKPGDEADNGHKTYDLRMIDGKPYLSPTSIKGMLRAAYEAVTNSRLSVFVGHDDRLAYRMSTKWVFAWFRLELKATRLDFSPAFLTFVEMVVLMVKCMRLGYQGTVGERLALMQ
ncbi:MAG: hypothetical protein HC860_17045 [Alkalinema sp. RU_4_3]|nr:hypothetical protein [Alkalinema sp. RU_4_3]